MPKESFCNKYIPELYRKKASEKQDESLFETLTQMQLFGALFNTLKKLFRPFPFKI